MEILFERKLFELSEKDYKYGFTLTNVSIDYPRLALPVVKITYSTMNSSLNILDNGFYSNEVCFEVSMSKDELKNIILPLSQGDIVRTIIYLLSREPNLLNAKYIMEKMPTSLYQNPAISKDIVACLPKNPRLVEMIQPIFDKKKKLIEEQKIRQAELAEKLKNGETSYEEILKNFEETFGE